MTLNVVLQIVLGAVVALASVFWIYFKILKISFRKNLVDCPDARKLQRRPVPVVGGLAVFFGVLAGLLVSAAFHKIVSPGETSVSLFSVLAAMSLMLYVGAMDDMMGLTPKSRFSIEIATILCLIYSSGMCIDTFQGMWGIGTFSWWFAVPLTVFAGVGIINAINMIDGVNGLSSGLCINCCVLFGVAFVKAGDIPNAILAFTMVGALIPFFIHNVFGLKSRMFIGDAGTMVIGMLMIWFLLCILSSESRVAYYETADGVNLIALSLAILSVPVFDTLRVMTMRMVHKKSPFSPDKTHLHHMFINVGISHFITAASEILIGITITAVWAVSVVLKVSLDWQLYIVIASSVFFVWGTYAFLQYNARKHTAFLHRIIGFSIRTHLGRTSWWKTITAKLDAPGDYSNVSFEDAEEPADFANAADRAEENRRLILAYVKGKAEVYVSDIMDNSGAERHQVYPIIFEEVKAGHVVTIKSDASGLPVIVALNQQ